MNAVPASMVRFDASLGSFDEQLRRDQQRTARMRFARRRSRRWHGDS
jgi:hypothetical protein